MSITDELREWVTGAKPAVVDGCSISVGTMTYGCKKALLAIADRIDAEHQKALEQEHNKGFTEGYDMGFANADDWLAQHEDAMEEHGWVRKDKEHVISHVTVEVTPHIDWSRMADELNELVEIVRGMAGDAE